jgi:hypothetical protein
MQIIKIQGFNQNLYLVPNKDMNSHQIKSAVFNKYTKRGFIRKMN